MEAVLSHRMRGVGSPETEHENVAVDPTKSCWVVGMAITEGATGGDQEGGVVGEGNGGGRERWGEGAVRRVSGGGKEWWEEEVVGGGRERINQLTKYTHCQNYMY